MPNQPPKKNRQKTIFICLFNRSPNRLDCDRANLTQRHLQLTFCGAKTVRQCEPNPATGRDLSAKKISNTVVSAFSTARQTVLISIVQI